METFPNQNNGRPEMAPGAINLDAMGNRLDHGQDVNGNPRTVRMMSNGIVEFLSDDEYAEMMKQEAEN